MVPTAGVELATY